MSVLAGLARVTGTSERRLFIFRSRGADNPDRGTHPPAGTPRVFSSIFGTRPARPATTKAASEPLQARDLAIAVQENMVLLDTIGSLIQLYGRHSFDVG